ncbi:MAG: amidase domain-containing protein [Nanoarchaeota archaeon]|nr:amidase domain-containing protein [Nanoarchaeota archaeon]
MIFKTKILAMLIVGAFVVMSSMSVVSVSAEKKEDKSANDDANFVAQQIIAAGMPRNTLDYDTSMRVCNFLHEEIVFNERFTTAYIRDFKRPPNFYPIIRPWPKPMPQPQPSLYSRIAAVSYADKYWDVYNTAYNDYSGSGGDDCNFVSQCMITGGIGLWKGYDGAGGGVDSKGTITYCDYFHSFLIDQLGADYGYINDSGSLPDWIVPGDIIIYGDASDSYRYAAIVVEGQGATAKVSTHTSDQYHVAWDYLFPTTYNRVNFYHIPDGVITEYTQFRVDAVAMNVRIGPGTQAPYAVPLGQIHSGEEYIAYEYVINATGVKWWHFWYDNRPAWCPADYTTIINENIKFKVTSESYLNVRSGAGITYPVVGNIFYAQAFTAFETTTAADNSTWYHFYYQGSDAWCCAAYTTQILSLKYKLMLIY